MRLDSYVHYMHSVFMYNMYVLVISSSKLRNFHKIAQIPIIIVVKYLKSVVLILKFAYSII